MSFAIWCIIIAIVSAIMIIVIWGVCEIQNPAVTYRWEKCIGKYELIEDSALNIPLDPFRESLRESFFDTLVKGSDDPILKTWEIMKIDELKGKHVSVSYSDGSCGDVFMPNPALFLKKWSMAWAYNMTIHLYPEFDDKQVMKFIDSDWNMSHENNWGWEEVHLRVPLRKGYLFGYYHLKSRTFIIYTEKSYE